MQGRDYQIRCCEAVINAIADGKKRLLCWLFTGAGKTVIFGLLARLCRGSKVLIIAPMRELVWQAADKCDRITWEDVAVEMAESKAQKSRVVTASIQTLLRGRYRKFLGYRLIIVDEAHTQMSDAVLKMLEEFEAAGGCVIGFTATPFRQDGKRLMDWYQDLAFAMTAEEGIDQGWCVPPLAKIVRCSALSLKEVRVNGGDYSAADLDMILGCSRPLHQMCATIQRERRGAAIAFLPGVASARALAGLAVSAYGMRAAFVCGDTRIQDPDERNVVLNRFRRGEIDVLCNCQVAVMGFDAPITRTIFQFRPTRSRVMAMQIWGRAMRPLPGVVDGDLLLSTPAARRAAIAESAKPDFRIIDITDALADHSLVTAVDMFAREDTPGDVIAGARQAAEEGDPQDPADLLAQAAEKLRKAKVIEEGLALLHGRAAATLHEEEVCLESPKKSIADYRVPLRGRFAGKRMGELDDGAIEWALRNPSIKGWIRSYFTRERARRRALARDVG